MRISKDLANYLADRLLQGKKETIDVQHGVLQNLAYNQTISSIKMDVLRAYDKFPKYFNTSEFVGILCREKHEDAVEVRLPSPVPSEGNWKVYIYVSAEEYKRFKSLESELEHLKDELRESKKIVANTIFGLRTALQVQKHFPEAYEFLPKESTAQNLPMLNLDHVRSLVK